MGKQVEVFSRGHFTCYPHAHGWCISSRGDALSILTALGLVIFIAQILGGFGLLIWDAVRDESGEVTITEWCARSWWRVAGVLLVVLTGWAGLALHLIGFAAERE